MVSYLTKLDELDHALVSYMMTEDYKQLTTSVWIKNYVKQYRKKLSGLIGQVIQAIGELEATLSDVTAPLPPLAPSDLNSLSAIFAETWYVTDKFSGLLQFWRDGCPVCAVV